MRYLLLIAALASPLRSAEVARSYIHEFYDARKIAQSDPDGAIAGMTRSFRMAVAAGNSDYATAAGLNACHLMYQQGKIAGTGKLAREVIDALEPFEPDGPHGDAVRRSQLFGFVERGLMMEGKIGAAWQANRAASETLRGRKVTADADGPAITVREVTLLPPELRSLGWRLIERESELLDLAGRGLDARALLDEAAAFVGKDWRKLAPVEQFYAFKLLSARSVLLDFLGYEEDAIRAQRELLAVTEGNPNSGPSRLNLKLNLQRNLSQWEGPSEERLAEARSIGAELRAIGEVRGLDRLLAKMELDLRDSREALETLRADARDSSALGHWFEAVYADRDRLVTQARQGEDGLDAEFTGLLAKIRAHGNKRGEPNLYREYGNYLIERHRPAEAIPLLAEALRLTRSFGWILHEPAILGDLFKARFSTGDLDGAKATLAELKAFLAAHPDLPVARRVRAETGLAIALARLGEKDAARAALKHARELASGLPEHQKRWLSPEMEEQILDDAPGSPAPAVAAVPPPRVQPLAVTSVARPGRDARTRFAVTNPGTNALRGAWKITGPGAAANATGDEVRFEAGKPVAALSIARSVPAGGETAFVARLAAAAGIDTAGVAVAWESAGTAAGPGSTWDVGWDPAATGRVVLDASSLETTPFRSVPLFHELAVPAGENTGIPFRLRSPVPLRIEYYDSRSQQLVAIDANGNGDFTEPGDLHVRGPSGLRAAILPVPAGGADLTVEVHIFAPGGQPLTPEPEAIVLEAEVHRDGRWMKEAEDTLR